LDEPALN